MIYILFICFSRNFENAIICVFWLWMLDIKCIIRAIWCYLQTKYFLVALSTTNDSFLFTAATKNFMFSTRCDQDFYTAFPWIYLPLFRVPTIVNLKLHTNLYYNPDMFGNLSQLQPLRLVAFTILFVLSVLLLTKCTVCHESFISLVSSLYNLVMLICWPR